MTRFRLTCLAAVMIIPTAVDAAPIGITLGKGGTSLVRLGYVESSTPLSSVAITDSISGMPVALSDIDFELETRELFGASAATGGTYRIDPVTGIATFRAALPVLSNAPAFAIDWNNAIDLMRLLSSEESDASDLNFVFNQGMNSVTQFVNVAYASGDANAGADPLIVGNAYLDAVATSNPGTVGTNPPPQGGVQLAIDARTNALVSVGNNAGTLSTIYKFSFDIGAPGGFDIYSVSGGPGVFDDTGYALLIDAQTGTTGIFEIALSSDTKNIPMMTLLRNFGMNADLRGLAIIDSSLLPQLPPTAPVPLPAPFVMLTGALATLFGLRRHRTSP